MNQKMCLICENADCNRTNELKQIRCKKFHTFVDAYSGCDYFTSKNQMGSFYDYLCEAVK